MNNERPIRYGDLTDGGREVVAPTQSLQLRAASSRSGADGQNDRMGIELDGLKALERLLRRAGYASLTAAVAEHTIFLHEEVVAQTGNRALLPVIRLMARRGEIDQDPGSGRRVMYDDNTTPASVFVWASGLPRGDDMQINHTWQRSTDPDTYTALWNLNATPAFLAKLTDTHPGARAALRYRAFDLYGAKPAGEPDPAQPDGYEHLPWPPQRPRATGSLEAALRARLRGRRSRAAQAAREIGWLYSDGQPDPRI